jgi:GNAT superfamily N-acetyltransferase
MKARISRMKITENELYQEITICLDDGAKIGEAEVEIKGKMLSRLVILEPYQNKGYGTEVVRMLNETYGCNCLWVNADNERAIHTYQKNGYELDKPTMYLMTRMDGDNK